MNILEKLGAPSGSKSTMPDGMASRASAVSDFDLSPGGFLSSGGDMAEKALFLFALRQLAKAEFKFGLSSADRRYQLWPEFDAGQVVPADRLPSLLSMTTDSRISTTFAWRADSSYDARCALHSVLTVLNHVQQQVLADQQELENALQDLHNADEEAQEEGFEPPASIAKNAAEKILRRIFKQFPQQYEVYPTSDQEIAIEIHGRHRHGVLILCGPGKEAGCYVAQGEQKRWARYSDAAKLPDAFVCEALQELQK